MTQSGEEDIDQFFIGLDDKTKAAYIESFRLTYKVSHEQNPAKFRLFLKEHLKLSPKRRRASLTKVEDTSGAVPNTIASLAALKSGQVPTAFLIRQLRKVTYVSTTLFGEKESSSSENLFIGEPSRLNPKIDVELCADAVRPTRESTAADYADALVRRFTSMASDYTAELTNGDVQWEDPSSDTLGAERWYIGRIISDDPNRLSATSVLFEPLVREQDGRSWGVGKEALPLTGFEKLKGTFLFENQLIAVLARVVRTTAGSYLHAVNVVSGFSIPEKKYIPGRLEDPAVQMCVVAGPYCDDTTFDGSRIDSLIAYYDTSGIPDPKLMVLLGPFVPFTNTVVTSCDPVLTCSNRKDQIHLTLDNLLQLVLERLFRRFNKTQIFIMPATDDGKKKL